MLTIFMEIYLKSINQYNANICQNVHFCAKIFTCII